MKRLFALALAALLLLTGCNSPSATKDFASAGLTLTLPNVFADISGEQYGTGATFLYGYGDRFILGVKEDKATICQHYPDISLLEFGTVVIQAHKLSCKLTQKDGFYCFRYTADGISYLAVVLESSDAFWTVQAYCPEEKFPELEDSFWSYLKTARFA